MVKIAAGPATRIFMDSYDMSGWANAADMAVTQEQFDARTFNTVGPAKVVGNYDHKHNFTLLWDGDSSQSDAVMAGLLGTADHYYTELFGPYAEGSVSYDSIVNVEGEPIKAGTGQLIVINGSVGGSGAITRGLVLCNATISGTGNRTGYNQGATTTGQTYAAIVRVLSGTFTSITVRIQESSDNGAGDAYADISGMTTTLTAQGVSRLTTTAATEAWKRARIQAFTGTSAVVLVTGGRVS